MPSPTVINVELSSTLTASICSHLAVELFKHIAYQRQQIPFPYKQLKVVLGDKSECEAKIGKECTEDKPQSNNRSCHTIQAQSEYRKIKGLFETMQSTFQNLKEEFSSENGVIKEVAMVLGATPLSPRDVFRLQFPPLLFGHLESKHPHQHSLLQLFRCLISSEELNSIVNQPLSPTNMFLFLRKSSTHIATSGFAPKERYNIPTSGKHVIIRLIAPIEPPKCICGGANIYRDCESGKSFVDSTECENSDDSIDLCWFQAANTLKGFKDIKINGTSASNLWLQTR